MNKYKTLSFFTILFTCISIVTIIASIYYLFNLMITRLFISILICIPSIIISAFLYAYAGAYKIDDTPKPKPDIKGVFVLEENQSNNELNLSKTNLEEKQDLFYSYSKNGIDYELKYLYDDVMILGYSFREPINDLKINEDLLLECEKDNQHDNHAVKVSVERDYGFHHIGYIAERNRIKEMAYDYLNNKNKRVFAKLVNNDTSDLRMAVAFFDIEKANTLDESKMQKVYAYKASNNFFEISNQYSCLKRFTFTTEYEPIDKIYIGEPVNFIFDYDDALGKNWYKLEIHGCTISRATKSAVEIYEKYNCKTYVTGFEVYGKKIKFVITMYDFS